MHFVCLYLLCHCVARDRGVNYARRVQVCMLHAQWISLAEDGGNSGGLIRHIQKQDFNLMETCETDVSLAVFKHKLTHSKGDLLVKTVFMKNS